MAHDWLGTFTKSQFDRFMQFARAQLPQVQARIAHLEAEQSRVGTVAFIFEGNEPISWVGDPADSYAGKLLAAYEVLGGNPPRDLRTRQATQPLFVLRGTEAVAPHTMSDGQVIGAKGLADGVSARLMRQARGWLDDTLAYRADALERKIRRCIDYSDELQREIDQLRIIEAAATTTGSLEKIAGDIQQLFADPTYRAIFDDKGADPNGLTAYAPFSSYDAAESKDPNLINRGPADNPQRQNSGFVGAGEKAGSTS